MTEKRTLNKETMIGIQEQQSGLKSCQTAAKYGRKNGSKSFLFISVCGCSSEQVLFLYSSTDVVLGGHKIALAMVARILLPGCGYPVRWISLVASWPVLGWVTDTYIFSNSLIYYKTSLYYTQKWKTKCVYSIFTS